MTDEVLLAQMYRITPELAEKTPLSPDYKTNRVRFAWMNEKECSIFIADEHGYEYEITIEDRTDSAELLDIIFQIYHKPWMSPDLLHDFLICLDYACFEVFGHFLQGVYCPCGNGHAVDWILRKHEAINPTKNSKSSDEKRRRFRERAKVTKSVRYDILKRDKFQCVLCGATGKTAELVVDHIVPIAKGGSSDMKNLRTLCEVCNQGRGAKD
jgi:hypothetical protein